MTFIVEGIPSVLWAFVWIARGARPSAAGSLASEREQRASDGNSSLMEQTSPARVQESGRAFARAGRQRPVHPVFLLELRRVRPCALDSRDDSLRLVALASNASAFSARRLFFSASCLMIIVAQRFPIACCKRKLIRVAVPHALRRWLCSARSQLSGHNFWLAYCCTHHRRRRDVCAVRAILRHHARDAAAERGRRSHRLGQQLWRAWRLRRNLAGGLAAGAHWKLPRRLSRDVDFA